jgi:hypothetical protein
MNLTRGMMKTHETGGYDRNGIFFIVDMRKVRNVEIDVIRKLLISNLTTFDK